VPRATIRPGGGPATAANDAYYVIRDIPLTVAPPGVLLNDTDPEGDPSPPCW
jgi:hypothetical protein